MQRIYSKNDFKVYTCMLQVLYDLELTDKDCWWLISDIEAVPIKKGNEEFICNKRFVLLKTSELVNMLKDEDFLWIWAVFSAIPSHYEKCDILNFELPYLRFVDEGQYDPHEDEPKLQHPYAEFEFYAVDSSYFFMITDDEELINRFKKCYPKYYIDETAIN